MSASNSMSIPANTCCDGTCSGDDKKRKLSNDTSTDNKSQVQEPEELLSLFDPVPNCSFCGVSHPEDIHDHEFNYVETIDSLREIDLVDPLTLSPLFDPRILPCGHIFSLNGGIQKQLQIKKQCPLKCDETIYVANLNRAPVLVHDQLNRLMVPVVS